MLKTIRLLYKEENSKGGSQAVVVGALGVRVRPQWDEVTSTAVDPFYGAPQHII